MRKLRSSLLLMLVALVLMSTRGGPSPFALAAAGAAAGAQEIDTDGDTMPDAWETFFGLDPNDAGDATGDPDGDGLTNAQEFADGRHPNGVHMRYFAEGSTGYFDTSVGVLNLSETETAHVAIALLNQAGGVVSHRFTLGPRARRTVSINEVLGVSAAVAIVVESDVPVAADRLMTWGTSGIGASLDSGAPAPATTWYFAEGATGPFLLYYLFQNPGMTPATVTIRYLVEGAPPVTTTHTLPPQSRTTVAVNQDDPSLAVASVGSVITSTAPIFAERAMYVNAGGTLGGGSASAGSNQLSTQWYFGEGSTGPFFQCFLSMLNPGATAATATVTYHMSDGSTASKAYPVPAGGRRTVYFNGEAASDPALAALATGPVWFTVSSTQPILGERAMWWFQWPWYEGHSAPGNTTSAVSWAVPEGRDGGATREQTYVLIGNTTTTPGQVRLTLIPDTGAPSTRDMAIAAGQRLTVNIGNLFGLTEGRFSVLVDSLGTPAVPLAVDYARYRSVNGVPFSGGGAAPAVPVIGDAAPSVTTTTPAANATGVAVDANLTVTFSEPVNAGAGAFVLQCPTGTPVTLTTLTVSPATTFTLDPATDLPISTACTLRIVASQVTDVDTTDPPDAMAADVGRAVHHLRVRDDHREPGDRAGRHRQPAVRPRHVHADGRHRAHHLEPHRRHAAGWDVALGSRRARRHADRVRVVRLHRDGHGHQQLHGIGAADAVDPVGTEPGAVVHRRTGPDLARGCGPAGRRLGDGDQPGAVAGRDRTGRDVQRHRQQPSALQHRTGDLAGGRADLHGGAERERDGHDHRGAAGQRWHGRRRRRHVRPTDLHDHHHGRQRRAELRQGHRSDRRRRGQRAHDPDRVGHRRSAPGRPTKRARL